MFDKPIFHLIRKEFIQLLRDPRMLRVAIMMPIVQLLMFGYIASTDLRHIQTAVYDEDNTSSSRAYLQNMVSSGYFSITNNVHSNNESEVLLDSGKVKLVLHIPSKYEKKLLSGNSVDVQAVIDGSNSSNATIILGYLNQINFNASNNVLKERLRKSGYKNGAAPFDVQTRIWYNPDLKSMNFMVPAIFSQILLMISMTLTSFSIVKEKEKGTIEQLIVTPLRSYELIIGKIVPPILVAFIDTVVSFLVAVLWFRVPFHGSVFVLMSLGAIFVATGLGIGIFISTVSKNQRQAIMTSNLIMSPMFILSGFVFPIASMPAIIQVITLLIPLRYFLVIVRGIFMKGIGFIYLWQETASLIVFGTIILGLSIARFKKKIE